MRFPSGSLIANCLPATCLLIKPTRDVWAYFRCKENTPDFLTDGALCMRQSKLDSGKHFTEAAALLEIAS